MDKLKTGVVKKQPLKSQLVFILTGFICNRVLKLFAVIRDDIFLKDVISIPVFTG